MIFLLSQKVHDTSPLDVGYKEMNGDEVHEGNEVRIKIILSLLIKQNKVNV